MILFNLWFDIFSKDFLVDYKKKQAKCQIYELPVTSDVGLIAKAP